MEPKELLLLARIYVSTAPDHDDASLGALAVKLKHYLDTRDVERQYAERRAHAFELLAAAEVMAETAAKTVADESAAAARYYAALDGLAAHVVFLAAAGSLDCVSDWAQVAKPRFDAATRDLLLRRRSSDSAAVVRASADAWTHAPGRPATWPQPTEKIRNYISASVFSARVKNLEFDGIVETKFERRTHPDGKSERVAVAWFVPIDPCDFSSSADDDDASALPYITQPRDIEWSSNRVETAIRLAVAAARIRAIKGVTAARLRRAFETGDVRTISNVLLPLQAAVASDARLAGKLRRLLAGDLEFSDLLAA